ncbi:helix-turn-helix domain-containing protein [Nocardioides sp. LHD-245]|uniref:helix-turn-helix domain-containing protein n=1 Tax=Nocardioides sp. LHD-245 TaxID=3051387 RepID=UPI0027DFC77E|nr:helix-turn-helix domain-containing protein [Nocardioides sp. LHD-245]
MKEPLTIDPAHADWDAIRQYLTDAAQAGEVVSLTAHVETLTPAEAARRLGMSRSTISRRISAGEIHTIKVGSHHRIPVREFERFHDTLMSDMVRATSDELEADLYGD